MKVFSLRDQKYRLFFLIWNQKDSLQNTVKILFRFRAFYLIADKYEGINYMKYDQKKLDDIQVWSVCCVCVLNEVGY